PEPLMHEWLLPVCSPGHLSREKAEFASLAGCRLLLNAPDGRDWKLWARELPYPLSGLDDGLKAAMRLPPDPAAIEMALAGFGVALANVHYIQKPLRDGALVPAIAIGPIKLGAHYVFRHAPQKPAVRVFVKWVRAAASASETDAALETAGVKATSHLRRGSDAGEHRR
ncbi:hypothetical protein I3A86_25165, partial [Salmonella enterica]|nr:hypothetical protein [Salmonella enterica]